MGRFLHRVAALALPLLVPFGAAAADLTVSAAASLSNAFQELKPLFEAAHPDTRVLLNFGASGALLQQMAKGAPVDVLASADQETMDQAQAQRLVDPSTRRNFASNTLVVVVPRGASAVPETLGALASPGYKRIAIGLPASVPVGRYTKAVLEQAGLWAGTEARSIGAHNVRQALDYAARGEVDAAFVYATDAALMPDRVRVAFSVPTNTQVLYPIALSSTSPRSDAARKFVSFVQSPTAQAVLARFGFGKP
jgi:molybdate transport system substrate-binding protein